MRNLQEEFHGLPSRGISGNDGQQGNKGQSIYIGFINDFFDYTEYALDPLVRYTKRKVTTLRNTTAWINYKSMYSTANIDQMYYTGEFVDIPAGGTSERKLDLISYVNEMPGHTEITDHEPIESYEFKFVNDVKYVDIMGNELEATDIYDYEDTTNDDSIYGADAVPAYTVKIDVDHITYDYSDLKRIAELKLKALGPGVSYSMWDFYTTHDEFGNQIEEPQSEQTYRTWLDDPERFPLFVREKLIGDFAEYRTGVSSYYGVEYTAYDSEFNPYTGYKAWPLENTADGRHYLLIPEQEDVAYNDMTYALMYFKQPVKTYPLYSTKEATEESEYLVDDEGYVYIGIGDNAMYEVHPDGKIVFRDLNSILTSIRETDADTPLMDQTNFVISDMDPYIQAIRDYKITLQHPSNELIPSDPRVVWHPGNDKFMKIPTTLSSDIHVGDIIYFYTDQTEFINTRSTETHNTIEYMAVVTEDMLGCDVAYLISHAQVSKPFTYSLFNQDYENDERAQLNMSTTITSVSRYIPSIADTQGLHNFNIKSIENMLSKHDHCALRLISANYYDNMKSAHFASFIAGNLNKFTSQIQNEELNLKGLIYNDQLKLNVIQPSTQKLIIHNFAVNNTNKQTNCELTDIVYDKNIMFSQDGHFIYNGFEAGDIRDTAVVFQGEARYLVQYEIIRSTMFRKPDEIKQDIADEYLIGYMLIKDNKLVQEDEKQADSLLMQFDPFTFYTESEFVEMAHPDDIQKVQDILDDDEQESIDADIFEHPKMTVCQFDVIFTIRKKTGMRYYSNIHRLNVFVDKNENGNYTIASFGVEPTYPVIEDTTISTEKLIQFDIPELTCEEYRDAIQLTVTLPDGLSPDKIMLNNIDLLTAKQSVSNNWLTITPKTRTASDLDNVYVFNITMKDNIPDAVYNDVVYDTVTVDDYMESFSTDADEDAPLFNRLAESKRPASTVQRSVKLYVYYTINSVNEDTQEIIKEQHVETCVITQPGFKEPRQIPEIKLSIVKDFNELDTVNTLENGVTCNMFRTYLDIEVSNFDESTWGMYNDEDVSIDFTINNIPWDYEWMNTHTTATPYRRASVKMALADDTAYYRFYIHKKLALTRNATHVDQPNVIEYLKQNPGIQTAYHTQFNIPTGRYIDSILNINSYPCQNYHAVSYTCDPSYNMEVEHDIIQKNANTIPNSIVDIDGKHYVIANSGIINACRNANEQDSGVIHDTKLIFKDIKISQVNNGQKIRVTIDTEFGNPVIASLFYQFAVTDICINYKDKKFKLVTSDLSSTYLHTITSSKHLYTYKSNPFTAVVQPVSVIAAPVIEEKNITDISLQGNVKKYGSEYNVHIRTEFYNQEIWNKLVRYDHWKNCMPGVTYFNDTVQNINITAINPSKESLPYVSWPDYYNKFIDDSQHALGTVVDKNIFNTQSTLIDLNDNRYLSIFYNAEIMNPRYRNNVETFYYQDEEYESERYKQRSKMSPILINVSPTVQLRDDETMHAIDTWNFEYQTLYKNTEITDNVIQGEKTLYGNGWYFLLTQRNTLYDGKNPYEVDGILSLNDLYNKIMTTSSYTISEVLTHNMQMSNHYPEAGKLFRTLVWDMKWEYPYENEGMVEHAIMVSPFDCLLQYCSLDKDKYNDTLFTHVAYDEHSKALRTRSGNSIVPYNLCYDISPRISYVPDTDTLCFLMLRKPSIGYDTDAVVQNETYMAIKSYLNMSEQISDTDTIEPYTKDYFA